MITPSAFDSEIFGLRVGWASRQHESLNGFDLVFLRGPYPTPPHRLATVMDVRHDLLRGPQRPTLRTIVVRATDSAFAEDVAAHAFAAHSRYFADKRLANRAPEIYRRWVQAAHAKGDLYVVPGRGFFSISREPDVLRLDLIAVAPDARRDGTGRELVQGFLGLPDDGRRRVRVEAGNVAALNLYITSGFVVAATESVQHVWQTE